MCLLTFHHAEAAAFRDWPNTRMELQLLYGMGHLVTLDTPSPGSCCDHRVLAISPVDRLSPQQACKSGMAPLLLM